MIVAGDFNAHHTVWGCGSIDSHARDINVMEENNLVLLNDRNPTTKCQMVLTYGLIILGPFLRMAGL